ncbi:MAG: EF-hand domain-containing protein [Rhodobacteraceae bacterium]|nr:EF-hand domain-containing protein [Paracoccaceae bacterium]
MKKILLTSVTILGFASAALAFDEGMDADNDGVLSESEMVAAYPDLTREILDAVDTDNDGNVSLEEWTIATESGLLG